MSHTRTYLDELIAIACRLDTADIERMATSLSSSRGRVYIIGLGGSMANAIHMAADLRNLCSLDAYAFSNIAELTARANDEGFDEIFRDWIGKSYPEDKLIVLSVGGGTSTVSNAICRAVEAFQGQVLGITGPDGGYTAERADVCIKIPVENMKHITPHSEAFQAVIWHCLVSHPLLQKKRTKW